MEGERKLAREACIKARAEQKEENEGEEVHYYGGAHDKEEQVNFEIRDNRKEDKALMFLTGHKRHHTCKNTKFH